ncbi:hypothetical protein QCA50_015131 [Cerrena zonata]|uniref:Uncharacterized protein n=1 Tax=Cerrena zonata TaxID=2478898 RepID=A0AAW0FRV2_9APHY
MPSRSRPVSQASKRFPEHTGQIPTVQKHERPERVEHIALRPHVVFSVASLMVLLGIALQVALHFSMKWDGFRAPPPSKVLSWLSPSFLTSFFPTILIAAPMAITWKLTDWAVRWFHPYVLLSQGNARAEDSLLLDYVTTNKFMGWWASLRRRHWLVFVSIFTGLVAKLFQPLAGALISLKPIATTNDFTVRNTAQIGLSPTFNDLNAFLAAAGFTEAAAFQGLPDPPFVMANWAAATIEASDIMFSFTYNYLTRISRTTATIEPRTQCIGEVEYHRCSHAVWLRHCERRQLCVPGGQWNYNWIYTGRLPSHSDFQSH